MMRRYSFRAVKISCHDINDLYHQLNMIDGKILSIKLTTPGATDTNMWYEVYYQFDI